MGPVRFGDPEAERAIAEAISSAKECLVEIYRPYGGGGGFQFFISSLEQLRDIPTWNPPGTIVFAWVLPQYPLHGRVDAEFIERAAAAMEPGKYYSLVVANSYPEPVDFLESVRSVEELRQEAEERVGEEVRFGEDPASPDYWVDSSDWPSVYVMRLEGHEG